MTQKEIQSILEIGTALSSEKDYNRLLEMILNRIMELTHCDAGTLYLADGDLLRFKIMRNNTLKTYEGGDGKEPNLPPVKMSHENVCSMCYLENRTICIENVRTCKEYDFSGPIRYDAMTGYHTQSMLVVPMYNRQGDRLGVIQLINALNDDGSIGTFSPELVPVVETIASHRICAFSPEMIPMVESIASQAAITIQNVLYIEEIKNLFESFVRVMSSAVDERTPYNASHTRHMVEYGTHFIDYLNEKANEAGKDILFNADHKHELLMSIWLHDIGKLVIPLEVMNKDARFLPEQKTAILHRFEKIRLLTQIAQLKGMISEETMQNRVKELKNAQETILRANTAGFCPDDLRDAVCQIHEKTYTEEDGSTHPWLEEEEFQMLMIRKGTLSEAEREVMESHVVITDKLLSEIRFSKELSHVREWAASHHELLNGSGYPKHLTAEQIPMEVRIITILDIFDALVADDRPYKPGMPIEKALNILDAMANKEGKLDPELTRLFIESKSWEKVQAEQKNSEKEGK